ncbi:hypothetical protein [Rodentibacter pneumotropicus]|uniref:hypothetical protein n=1 Tax=Rodentibacter pneumotropicus TaxID=758 RepID=UPI00036A3ADE|nr:hypothetical protein [Rodentibacter pneumotropicus]NBH74578.1 hypothetical protein [Rodentibacter pneumotropicus]OOF61815.1 hypothetical protein BH925_10560 [Rodentibacter pneumotropicus]THA03144.1 hypothetical protein D3M72_04425 [Rodentibacter pneumotropicus]THA05075.1 hypothetical protein D3M73_08530 [Rodentibacter pneumotropicus]THA11127.1 hypothetical protein D3M81_09435 [Rodentibacter pneumotropicus]
MAYNLEKKIKEFEFERKQVLHHLALLDANIATLKCAIDLMQQENDITLYNTQNFVYRRKFKLFKGKIRKYLVQILRNEPSKGFTIADLTQRIFEIEQNQATPTEKHLDSVRKQLNEFYQRDWLTRTQISRREVLWQWRTK